MLRSIHRIPGCYTGNTFAARYLNHFPDDWYGCGQMRHKAGNGT
nr:MAG TPA: hypothetical protein [Caudoviricetes sp.]